MWRALGVVALFLSCSDSVGREQLFAVDFGTVAIGEVHTSSLRVKNTRYVPSRLLRIEQREGARGFTIVPRYEPLPSNEETEWLVHFDAFEPGLKTARFVAIFERGESEVLLTARSAERCAIEPRVDFGAGPRGPRTLSFQLINDTDQPGAAFLSPLSPPFSSELTGRIPLAAGEHREVKVHFTGDTDGLFEQPWRVQPSPDCAATEVTLLASVQQTPLLVSPGRLHFADTVAQLRLEVRNATNAPIQLTPRIEGSGFHVADDAPFTVPGGSRIAVTVFRDDLTTAPLFAELVFDTTSSQQPQLRVPLLARYPTTCVTATDDVGFTSRYVGCGTASQRVTLTNQCPHEVRIGSPRAELPFHVVSAQPGFLAAGASTEVAVTFKPVTTGNVLAPMTISVDVLDGQQSVVVGLRGVAEEIPFHEETQRAPILWPDVDVLLVIDDTPVMAAYADSLRSNLERVNLAQTGRKPRYAVTTTSMVPGEQGKFRLTPSGSKWLEQPTITELQAHAAFTGTQTGGSSCLEAIAAADVDSLRRADASLMVLCVTANADAARGPVGLLFDLIRRKVPANTFFGLVARYATDASCPGELDSGTLRSLSDFTNGVTEDLCNPTWGASVDNTISYFGWRTNYFLEQRPDFSVAPLQVFVNGVELPQSSPPDRKWTYEAQTNSVNFEPLFVPEQGSELRFVYATACPR